MSDRRAHRRSRGERPPIRVDVACNDPDNGVFLGRAPMVQIGICEFEGQWWNVERSPRFVVVGDTIRWSGKLWPYSRYKYGLGNWCWDAFWMPAPTAADLVNWFRGRRLYDISTGLGLVFDWYKSDAPPMERQLLASLLESAVDT